MSGADLRREELEALLGCHVTADRDPENGWPGMTLWRVLVMAVLKQGLDCDYDRLGELVNHHQVSGTEDASAWVSG